MLGALILAAQCQWHFHAAISLRLSYRVSPLYFNQMGAQWGDCRLGQDRDAILSVNRKPEP